MISNKGVRNVFEAHLESERSLFSLSGPAEKPGRAGDPGSAQG